MSSRGALHNNSSKIVVRHCSPQIPSAELSEVLKKVSEIWYDNKDHMINFNFEILEQLDPKRSASKAHGKPDAPTPIKSEPASGDRKLHFLPGDRFSPEKGLKFRDRVVLTDDKGRVIEATVGKMMSTDFRRGEIETLVPYRLLLDVIRVDGVNLEEVELVDPGFFADTPGGETKLYPMRENGKPSPAIATGLRLSLNPGTILIVAPHKVEIIPGG